MRTVVDILGDHESRIRALEKRIEEVADGPGEPSSSLTPEARWHLALSRVKVRLEAVKSMLPEHPAHAVAALACVEEMVEDVLKATGNGDVE